MMTENISEGEKPTSFQIGEIHEPIYPGSSKKLRHWQHERQHSAHYMKLLQTSEADTLIAREESRVLYGRTRIMMGAHFSL